MILPRQLFEAYQLARRAMHGLRVERRKHSYRNKEEREQAFSVLRGLETKVMEYGHQIWEMAESTHVENAREIKFEDGGFVDIKRIAHRNGKVDYSVKLEKNGN